MIHHDCNFSNVWLIFYSYFNHGDFGTFASSKQTLWMCHSGLGNSDGIYYHLQVFGSLDNQIFDEQRQ